MDHQIPQKIIIYACIEDWSPDRNVRENKFCHMPTISRTACVIVKEVQKGDGDGWDQDYEGDVDRSRRLPRWKWKLWGRVGERIEQLGHFVVRMLATAWSIVSRRGTEVKQTLRQNVSAILHWFKLVSLLIRLKWSSHNKFSIAYTSYFG